MVQIETLGRNYSSQVTPLSRLTSSLTESVLALLQDKEIQEKAEEVGRLIFSNGSVTINLLPIITFTFLASLRRYFPPSGLRS